MENHSQSGGPTLGKGLRAWEIAFKKMNFIPGRLYHVYNEGNNGATLFETRKDDCLVFLRLIRKYLLPHVDIVAYCLMPTHFHLLLKTDERCLNRRMAGSLEMGEVSYGFKTLLSSYTRIMNKRRGSYGSLFRQRTRSVCLSHDEHLSHVEEERLNDVLRSVFHQIHDEPVRAGLVQNPEDWLYSSFRDYAGLRNGTLINKHAAWESGIIPSDESIILQDPVS